MDFKNFYEAYKWLYEHPIFQFEYKFGPELKLSWASMSDNPAIVSFFDRAIDINVVKVNPKNDTIDDDETLNTKTAVWIEIGTEWDEEYNCFQMHVWYLDTGGDTYEEAILSLAQLVWKYYGNTNELIVSPYEEEDDE